MGKDLSLRTKNNDVEKAEREEGLRKCECESVYTSNEKFHMPLRVHTEGVECTYYGEN